MRTQPAPKLGAPLTDREHDVLFWVAYGLRNDGVADKLDLSVDTVKTHLRRIFRKFGVVDRAGMVTRGFVLGYLNADSGHLYWGDPAGTDAA